MNELIKVTEENGEQLVSARELYEFLELDKSNWSRWSKKNIEEMFEENQEYQRLVTMTNGNETTEYVLKLDVAKEISMLARSEKGKQIRKYFVELEKAWNSPEKVMARALQIANKQIETYKEQIEYQKPKVEYYEKVLKSEETFTTTQVSKIFGMSAIGLNKQLELEGIQFKQRGTWLLKSKYQNKGYAKIETIPYGDNKTRKQLVWTEKGIEFISNLIEKL